MSILFGIAPVPSGNSIFQSIFFRKAKVTLGFVHEQRKGEFFGGIVIIRYENVFMVNQAKHFHISGSSMLPKICPRKVEIFVPENALMDESKRYLDLFSS